MASRVEVSFAHDPARGRQGKQLIAGSERGDVDTDTITVSVRPEWAKFRLIAIRNKSFRRKITPAVYLLLQLVGL